jgi:hypothetical protein
LRRYWPGYERVVHVAGVWGLLLEGGDLVALGSGDELRGVGFKLAAGMAEGAEVLHAARRAWERQRREEAG